MLAGFCNCRAETVPAPRTATAIAAKNAFLIVLLILHLSFLMERKTLLFELLSWLGSDKLARTYRGSGVVEDARAAQNVGAACFLGAEAPAGNLSSQRQLPRRNRSRAENGHRHRCQKRVLNCLAHDSPFLSRLGRRRRIWPGHFLLSLMGGFHGCWFPAGTAPANFVVQNAVSGVVKEQTQPAVAHGLVALQVPPQVGDAFTPSRNWRAETVPAQRAARTNAANAKVWMFFLIIALLSTARLDRCSRRFPYLITVAPGMGCDEQNALFDSMGKMQRQPLAQGLLMPQLPPQVAKPLSPERSWRAETVPAQRTAVIIAASNVVLIFFVMATPI
jgi:hypothetical protein